MKKLLTITLTFCTFIVAMACGSNEPDVDGTTGATEALTLTAVPLRP